MNRIKDNVALDQFFTKPEEAKRLFGVVQKLIDLEQYDIILEPSVGSNSFGCLFPPEKRVLMDIDPKDTIFSYDNQKNKFTKLTTKKAKINIIQMDYLSLGKAVDLLGFTTDKKIIAIGNPPFGKNSSLAVKFFNICSKFCDTICFIIPITFKRISIQNQLDLNFHLTYSEDLPFSTKECVFEPHMNAKCCFQIWERKEEKREKTLLPSSHPDWEFLPLGPKEKREGCAKEQPTPPKNADFAMKAYGSNCGEIVTTNLHDLRPKSWHWFKSDNPEKLIKRFQQLDYSISKDTVRQDSIGRAELVKLYSEKFDK